MFKRSPPATGPHPSLGGTVHGGEAEDQPKKKANETPLGVLADRPVVLDVAGIGLEAIPVVHELGQLVQVCT